MENSIIFVVYLLTFLVGAALTLGLIKLLNKGLRRFFDDLCQDKDVANFFIRLVNIILLFGGLGAALKNGYATGDKTNRLTLIWDSANQIQEPLERLFIILMILAITFLILHLMAKKLNK